MCDIHSATVSSCELSVCILCAVVSCLSAAVSCLCAAVYCSHHTHRYAVSTVVVLQSSLFSFLSAPSQPPKRLLHMHTRESHILVCVYAMPLCVSIIPRVSYRERKV